MDIKFGMSSIGKAEDYQQFQLKAIDKLEMILFSSIDQQVVC